MGRYRKHIENPCQFKGRYGGTEYVGQSFIFKGREVEVRGCECNQPFIPHGNEAYLKKYAISHDFKNLTSYTLDQPKDCYKAVPCGGFFKNSNSRGTRLYRKFFNTSFAGCSQIEKFTIENRLQVPVPIHADERMRFYSEVVRGEKNEAQANLKEFYHYLANSKSIDVSFAMLTTYFSHSLSAPKDILQSFVRKLFYQGEFLGDKNVHITAFLIDQGIDWERDQGMVTRTFPNFPTNEYYSLQSKVYATAKKQIPERFKSLKLVLGSLTKRQKQALEAVYLNNEPGITHEEIANNLGIKRSSLRSRLEGARKKIIAALKEYY